MPLCSSHDEQRLALSSNRRRNNRFHIRRNRSHCSLLAIRSWRSPPFLFKLKFVYISKKKNIDYEIVLRKTCVAFSSGANLTMSCPQQ